MALPILDGNQTAATLSTIITGGAHIPAHTVVSLGSQAISDITNGVSGSVVSISNFPSTQTIAGTVTANTQTQYFDPVNQITLQRALISFIVNENDGESYPVDHANGLPISGTVTANVFGLDQALSQDVRIPVLGFDTNISDANLGAVVPVQISNTQGAIGSGNPLPVTANGSQSWIDPNAVTVSGFLPVGGWDVVNSQFAPIPLNDLATAVQVTQDPASAFTVIASGTVTANVANVVTTDTYFAEQAIKVVGPNGGGIALAGFDSAGNQAIIFEDGGIPVYPRDNKGLNAPFPISGTVTANIGNPSDFIGDGNITLHSLFEQGSLVVGAMPAISGTVTANNPNGALTTRFGSVVTANLAFITSAVTNTSRKYLLAQNISAGTVTIGIGFSPTTTQGIQLSAGGGLTFDAFCPTGAVYWLGAVTGAAFTILEG